MGPFRRRLNRAAGAVTLLLTPGQVWAAESCTTLRPDWDGAPVSQIQELVALASTAPSMVLLLASALVIRFRSQWGGLVTVLLWTGFCSLLNWGPLAQSRVEGRIEGCIGAPSLFFVAVAAICVAMILYTAPLDRQRTE